MPAETAETTRIPVQPRINRASIPAGEVALNPSRPVTPKRGAAVGAVVLESPEISAQVPEVTVEPPSTANEPDNGPAEPKTHGTIPRTESPPLDGATPDNAASDTWKLVEQTQQGDMDAFAKLYGQYYKTVYNFALYRTGKTHIAEDLTSEVFTRLLSRIHTVTWQGRDIGALLVTITRNLVIDHYKSHTNQREILVEEVGEWEQPDPSDESNPEVVALGSISDPVLLAAIRLLSPEQQECITFRFLMGMTVDETSAAMGKGRDAVKSMQHRALTALRKEINTKEALFFP